MTRIAILFLALAASAAPSHAGQIKERTSYFTVRGSTLAELDREFGAKGPMVGTTGQRHMGATKVEFDGKVTYRRDGDKCRVDVTNLGLALEMMLPEWRPRGKVSAETATLWRTISRDIERHERKHAEIAKLWLGKMENAIRGLGPERDCEAMEARVERTADIFLQRHEEAQQAFDRQEGRESSWRLRRALRDDARAIAER